MDAFEIVLRAVSVVARMLPYALGGALMIGVPIMAFQYDTHNFSTYLMTVAGAVLVLGELCKMGRQRLRRQLEAEAAKLRG